MLWLFELVNDCCSKRRQQLVIGTNKLLNERKRHSEVLLIKLLRVKTICLGKCHACKMTQTNK